MDTATLLSLATRTGLAVGLVCDPGAEPAERWVCTIGLDVAAAGPTPGHALALAAAEWYTSTIGSERQPKIAGARSEGIALALA